MLRHLNIYKRIEDKIAEQEFILFIIWRKNHPLCVALITICRQRETPNDKKENEFIDMINNTEHTIDKGK